MSERRLAGGREIVLPMSKAVEISFRSLKIRFGRSLITTSGVILAIAFLMSVWSNNEIISSLRNADKSEINLLLQKNGIETGVTEAGDASAEAKARIEEEQSKQTWLISLSLLVCVVGIANAMLMSVTERFREIGTMKCLGALDTFIVKLFLLESTFQGLAGTSAGIRHWLCADAGLGSARLRRLHVHLFPTEWHRRIGWIRLGGGNLAFAGRCHVAGVPRGQDGAGRGHALRHLIP